MKGLGSVWFEWIPREKNEEADLLTWVAYDRLGRTRPGGKRVG